MNIPQEFEDVFHGVELTENALRTLIWITGWESRTVENLRSAIQKVQATAISTLQAENEKLRAELEQVKADRSRYKRIAEAQDRRIDELEAEFKRYVEFVKNCSTTN